MSIFKNISLFKLSVEKTFPDLTKLEAALAATEFRPCYPSEELSVGWLRPRKEAHSPFLENIGNQLILKLAIEKKSVPSSVVKEELASRCKDITEERGKAPGKKEKKELKEIIYREFLPRAFSKITICNIWITKDRQFLIVGATSSKITDSVTTELIKAVSSFDSSLTISPIRTEILPSTAMSLWLKEEASPDNFTLDQDLQLTNFDTRAIVKYSNHPLNTPEVVSYINQGMTPTQLALTWSDRLSFVLDNNLCLKKISTIESLFVESDNTEGFDADVAICTGELSLMFPDLIKALGGEAVLISSSP